MGLDWRHFFCIAGQANANGVSCGIEACDAGECTPLWLAALAVSLGMEDGLDLAKLLVEYGADIDPIGMWEDGSSSSPLLLAAKAARDTMSDAQELLILLVSKGGKLVGDEGAVADGQQYVDRIHAKWSCLFINGSKILSCAP